jgi:hypothetical protein
MKDSESCRGSTHLDLLGDVTAASNIPVLFCFGYVFFRLAFA